MPRAIPVVLLAACLALVTCVHEGSETAPPFGYSEVEVPASQADPVLLNSLALKGAEMSFIQYVGGRSFEEIVLLSDVIARVSLVEKRTSTVKRLNMDIWAAVLEFRFTVHEYLKGTGATEIGGLVYIELSTQADATAGAAQIGDAHDARWDDREAIVFLKSTDEYHYQQLSLPLSTGQYWFGAMWLGSAEHGVNEAYTVASIHRKLWLPEATQPSQQVQGQAGQPSAKVFLLDAPARSEGGAMGTSAQTLPTVTLANLKARVKALEAEANAGGTAAYRECVEAAYTNIRLTAHRDNTGGTPYQWREATLGSGLSATTTIWENDEAVGLAPDKVGREGFAGQDSAIVRYVDSDIKPDPLWGAEYILYTRTYVTTRPLPAGEYRFFHNYLPNTDRACPTDPSPTYNHSAVELTVTAPSGVLHEAFFDPVAMGNAVGADGNNGVLRPTAFSVGNTATALSSLKWEGGSVKLALSPNVSLSGYALDFIDLKGAVATTLNVSSAAIEEGAYVWPVSAQPWSAGDLLMVRIRSTPTAAPTATPVPKVLWADDRWQPLSRLSLPAAGYGGEDHAADLCNLEQEFGPPRRLEGLSFSLSVRHRDAPYYEMRFSVRNDTDKSIDYAGIHSATIFAIVNTRTCRIYWREPPYENFERFRYDTLYAGKEDWRYVYWYYATHDGPAPAGSYVPYAIYRFADPPESHVPNAAVYVRGATIEIDPVLRHDPSPTTAEPALRTIDLGRGIPAARLGRKLITHSDDYGGRHPRTYDAVDLDTGERTEITRPEHIPPVPQGTCEPPKGLKLAKELVFPYVEGKGHAAGYTFETFNVSGVLGIALDTGYATAWVPTGTTSTEYDQMRFYQSLRQVYGPVWSNDCRYAAWAINQSCDVQPITGPYGAFLYDTATDTMTRIDDEPGHHSVSFWDDLVISVGVCPGFGLTKTTGMFLDYPARADRPTGLMLDRTAILLIGGLAALTALLVLAWKTRRRPHP